MSLSFKNCFMEAMSMDDGLVSQLKSSMHVLTQKWEPPSLSFETLGKHMPLHLRERLI